MGKGGAQHGGGAGHNDGGPQNAFGHDFPEVHNGLAFVPGNEQDDAAQKGRHGRGPFADHFVEARVKALHQAGAHPQKDGEGHGAQDNPFFPVRFGNHAPQGHGLTGADFPNIRRAEHKLEHQKQEQHQHNAGGNAHGHVLELVHIPAGSGGVVADGHGGPDVADGRHAGRQADAEGRSQHNHIAGGRSFLHFQYLENILQEGHKGNEQNGRGNKESHKGYGKQQKGHKGPGPSPGYPVGDEADGAAPDKVGLGQGVHQHEGEQQERHGGIPQGSLQGFPKTEAGQKAQEQHGNQAGPVDGDGNPHQQGGQEDAQYGQAFLGKGCRGGQAADQEACSQGNHQPERIFLGFCHGTRPLFVLENLEILTLLGQLEQQGLHGRLAQVP